MTSLMYTENRIQAKKEALLVCLFPVYHIIKLLKVARSSGYSSSNLIGRSTIA